MDWSPPPCAEPLPGCSARLPRRPRPQPWSLSATPPEHQDPWGRAHTVMVEQGCCVPGREAQAMAYCEAMARQYPQDADAWLREKALYARFLDLRPGQSLESLNPSSPRYVPLMTGVSYQAANDAEYIRDPGEEG